MRRLKCARCAVGYQIAADWLSPRKYLAGREVRSARVREARPRRGAQLSRRDPASTLSGSEIGPPERVLAPLLGHPP